MVTIARTDAELDALVARLTDPNRERPLVVATTTFATGEPFLDLDRLASDVGDVADLALISSGQLTYRFAAALPPGCETYNGAVRSFPGGADWMRRPERARRRFSFFDHDRDRMHDSVVDDVLGMAHRAGLTRASTSGARAVTGTVQGLVADGSRAIVQLDDGGLATITAELAFPPAPLDWVIRPGMTVHGMLDPESRRLALDPAIAGAGDLWSRFPDGSVTLALVHEVDRQRATLLVHPAHPVTVTRAELSANPRDRVDLLLAEGDVIEVRVVRGARGEPALRTIDLDDDETVLPAVALTPGGMPWLEPGRPLPATEADVRAADIDTMLGSRARGAAAAAGPVPVPEAPTTRIEAAPPPAPAPAQARPVPGAGPRRVVPLQSGEATSTAPHPELPARGALQSALATVDALKAQLRAERAHRADAEASELGREVAQLKDLIGELARDARRASDEAAVLRERLGSAQSALRQARRTGGESAVVRPRDRRDRFTTAEDWVRHELYLLWIERLDATTRAEHPLPEKIAIGDRFCESLEPLDDGQLAKALRCAMEAVTHFIGRLPAREVHPLRSGDGGDDAPVVRSADGARCLRAYIEQSTPQARRLHYWSIPGGGIELERVVPHDDVEP